MLRGSGGSRRQRPRQPDPWTRKLALGTWNVTSLAGKEPEIVREVERFRLEIVGITSTHGLGSGTTLLERGWTLSHSGVARGERRRCWCGFAYSPPAQSPCVGVVGLSWLTHLCNIAWRSRTVPLGCQTGVVVPLFKKGGRWCCSVPTTGGSHFSASPGKSIPGYWRGESGR